MTVSLDKVVNSFTSPIILLAIFVVALIVFAIVSPALRYHWKNYNVNSALVRRLSKVYFWVSGFLLLGMLISIILYSYA